jgi:glucosamine-phosphate N-acetyltransferase
MPESWPDHPHYVVRPLARDDYGKGFAALLSELTTAEFTQEEFHERFDSLAKAAAAGQPTFCYVAEHIPTQQLAATASCLIELKFIHGTGVVGHVEDVVTSSAHRKKGLTGRILRALHAAAEREGCYKIILDCDIHNVPVYLKTGYVLKAVQMARYLPVSKL